ncbi:MAG TPA: hypothetical protein EYP19_16435, partial [Desulfobacterales bacterium]|nr:hypothetical protein [Desulfobacterales bacterium]
KDVKVACIGQAGENLVRAASTIFDKYHSAARGSGAVFGSKNLKAIAVRGEGKVNLADSEKFKKLAREDREFFLKDKFQQEIVKNYGSHYGIVNWFPSYRNSEKYLSKEEIPEELTPEALKKYEIRRYACYGCVVACKDVYRIPEGEYEGEIGSGAEFELFHELGLGCGITKVVPILVAQNLCDKYGLDVMPLGYTIALAKDLYNRGIITKDDTQGLSLEWEDAESQIELIHQTALREGFGDKIAEGLYSFAKMVGEEAVKYCYHVKGLCRGGYPYSSSETVNLVYALSHATSTRGADHLRGRTWAYGEQYAEMFKDYQEKGIIPKDIPSLVVCAERAALIADILRDNGADAASITAPASLAWLFNIRGGDVACSPLPLGRAIIRKDGSADLFIDPRKETGDLRTHLGNQVTLHPLEALDARLTDLKGQTISLDPGLASAD